MVPAIKRRKVSTANSSSTTPATRSRGLDAFTRVSKASSVPQSIIDKNTRVDSITIEPSKLNSEDRKRKLEDIVEDVDNTAELPAVPSAAVNTQRAIKPLPQKRASSPERLPRTPKRPTVTSDLFKSTETPSKKAAGLLDRLFLSSTTPTRSPHNSNSSSLSILDSTTQELPVELLDLIDLHAAFLTALSLHYAHNGTNSPADLRLLCPNVARAWGKRAVTLEDIRRTLGVMNTNYSDSVSGPNQKLWRLSLSDYGHGKICIEIRMRSGMAVRPLDENLLNGIYGRGLKDRWQARPESQRQLKDFISELPMEPITMCSSVIKMSPLLAKGQRRLEDMKAGIIIRKEAAKEKVPTVTTPNGTRPTLLERLRMKQLEKSNQPAAPTKAELSRKAALQRIEEVVAVLTVLSTSSSIGQSRVSFTLPTVIGKLRDSFKTPMSKDEADTAVRLLAADIAPEWIKIVKMGKMEAMVVNRDERPQEADLKERVKRAA
ncbi:hypothetical protein PVAG01_03586 [Phlyctema vagabunda]|uniref:DNA replication factor Cdt1 C-terminal domain-containing protein n=1 Tax=Phlyctema vagabunda TaxID=108571 RepID=A0ABR4PLX3_9HELO